MQNSNKRLFPVEENNEVESGKDIIKINKSMQNSTETKEILQIVFFNMSCQLSNLCFWYFRIVRAALILSAKRTM